ncbi:hypothetical protein ERN12_05190 [Rhodobacteraceae bacterium]|nr:hypothetical protein ERN12_05190 [Paracoccaceae bacterium]
MIRYRCPTCSAQVYFANQKCLSCQTDLVFTPGKGFDAAGDVESCANRDQIGCNWRADQANGLCRSCAHSTLIPDLAVEGNAERWAKFEASKRILMRMLIVLDLPLSEPGDKGTPRPRFLFKGSDQVSQVIMGHADGDITLNIAEADDDYRVAERADMGERYRTLIGHLRHETGHAYWEVLVRPDEARLSQSRAIFGDDRLDYAKALDAHYKSEPPQGWQQSYVSEYATAHPYEDFAESWANLLHILDGLETAQSHGVSVTGRLGAVPQDPNQILQHLMQVPFDDLVAEWIALSVSLNALNETMGHASFYPFILSPKVGEKLEWIRGVIAAGKP